MIVTVTGSILVASEHSVLKCNARASAEFYDAVLPKRAMFQN
jgi:hypothetical protein